MSKNVGQCGSVVEQYAQDGSWVIVATGELDIASLDPLREAMEDAAAAHPVVVLNAEAVTFADSSALNLLLRIHRATTLRVVVTQQSQLFRLLELTGATRILDLYPTTAYACSGGPASLPTDESPAAARAGSGADS